MKPLLKIAMAAGFAGFVANLLIKRLRAKRESPSRAERFDSAAGPEAAYDDSTRQSAGENVTDINGVADTNGVGDENKQRGAQPQDWRGAQNVLE